MGRNFLIMLNNLQQMQLKLLQKESFRKQQKQLVISLVIKLAIELREFQKNFQQNNLETVKKMHDKEIPKERYISPEERQGIIDKLRLK